MSRDNQQTTEQTQMLELSDKNFKEITITGYQQQAIINTSEII